MARVYVNSKQECPRDAVLREGPQGRLFYRPEERGTGAEVGGVMDSFEELFSTFYKRRIYVDNPASVPPEFEPRRGGQGGWFYERPDEQDQGDSNVLEQLVDMIVEQIIPELHQDEYYQDDIAPRVYETVQDRVQLSEEPVTENEFKSLVKDSVEETMSDEKEQLDRVYVADESQVPNAYDVQEDENGDMFYVRDDGMFIDSGRETTTYEYSKSLSKEYELEEGLEWTERVMVTDIDEEAGVVTMVDTEGSSEWEEPIDSVEAKLKTLEATDHDWMYELIAGEYAYLDDDEVHDALHNAAGLDKGVRLDYESRMDKEEDPCWDGYTMVGTKENGDPRCVPDDDVENYDADKSLDKSKVYVDNPDEVPDQYEPQTSDNGAIYYETDMGAGGSGEPDDMGIDTDSLDEKPEEELEDLRDYLMEQHSAARDARDARGGRGTDTAEDDLMRDILDTVREIDSELMDRDGVPKSQKSRVYVGDESEVPDQYDVQTSDRGAVYYETDSGSPSQQVDDAIQSTQWEESGPGSQERVDIMGEEILDIISPREMMREMIDGDLSVEEVVETPVEELFGEAPEEDRQNAREFLEGVVQSEIDSFNDGELEEMGFERSQKSRVYVEDESEVPEQYDPQTSDSGATYYETDSGGGERERVGDEVTDDQIDEMEENVAEIADDIGPEIRTMGEDEAYDLAADDPDMDAEEINEIVRENMTGEAMERIQEEFGVQLEGDAYDAVNEAIADEMADWMGDAEVTEQDVYEIRDGF